MLKQKALTKNLTATYCTTTNTLFVHNKKTVNKAAFVYTQNAQKSDLNFLIEAPLIPREILFPIRLYCRKLKQKCY